MHERHCISNVRFVAAPARLARSGLLGWTTVAISGGLDLGYIAVRRTPDGRVVVPFPEHVDRAGTAHDVVRPLDQATHKAITSQLIAELKRQGVLP